MLIAFEGLDQSGKETQARLLVADLRARGRRVETLSFPDYQTAIGREIGEALAGRRDYGADVMQLLYIANRFEKKPQILEWRAAGAWWCAIATSPPASPTASRRGSIPPG